MIAPLFIHAKVTRQIIHHAVIENPKEACGILAGDADHLREAYPVMNISDRASAYHMDPREQHRIMLRIEESGYSMAGFYHSHPHGPGDLSETDINEFRYPGLVNLIIYPQDGEWQIRAFTMETYDINERLLIKVPDA